MQRAFTSLICLLLSITSFSQILKSVNPELLKAPWKASWIAMDEPDRKKFGVYHFRKKFELPKAPNEFVINISADNRYWLFVNGKRICTGPAKGDLNNWRFETIDLASYLKTGENIIAAVVWNHGEYRAWSQISEETGFLIQGNSQIESVVNTDASWKVYKNFAYTPLFEDFKVVGSREQIFSEYYPWGWENVNYNDKNWTQAKATRTPVPVGVQSADTLNKRKLIPRNIPLPEEKQQRFSVVRKMEGLPLNGEFLKGNNSLTIHPWGNVTILIDQEYLTTAYPELLISGGKGAKITLTYMEAPFINFKNEEKGNRNEIENKTVYGIQDIFYPDGQDNRSFRPLYYRTFRYVEVKIVNYLQPLVINDFYSVFTGYPFEEKSAFESNDKSLKDIWNVGWRTARLCAYETYMDCPYYEQLQYIGDTRIQALVSLYVSGDDRLIKNAIQQFADSRNKEGLTNSRYPDYLKQIIPPFSLFWINMISDLYNHKNEDVFVKSHLAGIKEVLDWHIKYINKETGMLGVMPHWNFIDWPKEWPWTGTDKTSGLPKAASTGNSSIHTLLLAYTLQNSIPLFEAFGKTEEKEYYTKIKDVLLKSTKDLCWDKNKKFLADSPEKRDFSQHANVLAILTGAIPKEDQKELLEKVIKDTNIVQCTVYFRFYLNQALKKAGLADKYISLLTPWRDMLNIGLTTFAEKPEPSRSDCHAWSASPCYDLLATVIGIEPSSKHFETVKIEPHLGSLEWADGKLEHPSGLIKVSIRKNKSGGGLAVVEMPKSLTGEFIWNNKVTKLKGGIQKIKL